MDFEKSMKYANKKRTICEVVRECNDIIDGRILEYQKTDGQQFDEIREKLKEIHSMAKSMTKKLYKYSKKWDKDFWRDNPDYEEDLKRRMGNYAC